MKTERFDVRFDADAEKEYLQIDNSLLRIVNAAIDELVYRADEVGKKLSNHSSTKLAGCKEIKLRDAGIRIIFRLTNETVDILRIVYILSVERRSHDRVFKIADQRLKVLKAIQSQSLKRHLSARRKWAPLNLDREKD